MIVQLLIVLGVLLVIVIILVIIGLRAPRNVDEDFLQERLAEYSQRGEEINLEKIELSQPFSQRVIYPLARSLGELAIKFTPQNALQSISRKLELAGSPARLDPTIFLALQFIAAVTLGGLVVLVFSIGTMQWPFGRVLIFAIGFAALGFYLPTLWIQSQINRRQKSIRNAMPDALDLLTICVEAGLGFDAAMARVSNKWKTELSLAFARTIQEIQLGKTRRDALRDMADRLGVPEMTSFVAAVIQSEQLGVSMAKVLRIQADQMRTRRRQLAEEEAHKAPIKMLVPMALLIFPSLMIVLLTPAAIRMIQGPLASMFK
ncbi:MAG: type II secretion system F family protein [Anaerolineae bacterium]|nr:type II secretion system F family protein [Anaerolineae bacterium]